MSWASSLDLFCMVSWSSFRLPHWILPKSNRGYSITTSGICEQTSNGTIRVSQPLTSILNFVLKGLFMCWLQMNVIVMLNTSSGDILLVYGVNVVNDFGYTGRESYTMVKTVGNFAVFFNVKTFSTLHATGITPKLTPTEGENNTLQEGTIPSSLISWKGPSVIFIRHVSRSLSLVFLPLGS